MPGGRLTYEDRWTIEDGLARRLAYAEIARQLDRPTSTVSREVARNGGRHGYQAWRADLATAERARRAPDDQTGTSRQKPRRSATQQFDDRFANVLVQSGLPRMPAKVLVCLVTYDGIGMTAAQLSARLRVSPASISKAVGYLENLDLLVRDRDPSSRRDRYAADEGIWHRSYHREIELCTLWANVAAQGATTYGTATPAGTRLAEMSRFLTRTATRMTAIAEAWRKNQ